MSFFKKNQVKTRFAPSPTGYLHLGSLRTLLYSYLFAKQRKGEFLLRIEDTDQTREVPGAVDQMLKIINWLGLRPDEGPFLDEKGKISEQGKFGPYIQSKRKSLYEKYAQELIDKGGAYYCFCAAERLERLRKIQQAEKKPTRYDGHCRKLTPKEIKEKLTAGEDYVVRLKVPKNQKLEFTDWVKGKMIFKTDEIDDQILLKSDGFPTYHLALVVDDHLMKVTQVVRGEEWLPSTPKHILTYFFLGWEPPDFIHLPLILNPDRTKLSKRQEDVAVEDYQRQGYLPEALINFSALLGWNPGDNREIFSLEELIKEFSFSRVQKSPAAFDRQKLNWINREHLKRLDFQEFKRRARPFLRKNFPELPPAELELDKVLALEQERISKLEEIGRETSFFFQDNLSYNPELLVWKKSTLTATRKNLEWLTAKLETFPPENWRASVLSEFFLKTIKETGLTNGEILWPFRVALTGQKKSPSPFEVAEILGRRKALQRIQEAQKKLEKKSGPSDIRSGRELV